MNSGSTIMLSGFMGRSVGVEAESGPAVRLLGRLDVHKFEGGAAGGGGDGAVGVVRDGGAVRLVLADLDAVAAPRDEGGHQGGGQGREAGRHRTRSSFGAGLGGGRCRVDPLTGITPEAWPG